MSEPKRRPSKRGPTNRAAGGGDPPKRKPPDSAPRVATGRGATRRTPVDPATIRLVPGKGSAGRGGDSGGYYWHIHAGEARAGHVYINVIDEAPFGRHASIQIHINQSHRGRGIGRIAYRSACEQGGHDLVVAHMRKSNVASRRAAAAAGFEAVEDPAITQLALAWRRKR